MPRPPRRAARSATSDDPSPTARRDIPAWLQAIAAVLTVGLTALALLFGLGRTDGRTTPVASGGPAGAVVSGAVASPDAEVTGFTVGPSGIRVTGQYRALRPAEQTLYLIARPKQEPSRDWLPVRAELSPATQGVPQDGAWAALLPVPPGTEYVINTVILPGTAAAGAAGGQLDEVRRRGVGATGVLDAGSESVVGS